MGGHLELQPNWMLQDNQRFRLNRVPTMLSLASRLAEPPWSYCTVRERFGTVCVTPLIVTDALRPCTAPVGVPELVGCEVLLLFDLLVLPQAVNTPQASSRIQANAILAGRHLRLKPSPIGVVVFISLTKAPPTCKRHSTKGASTKASESMSITT